MSNLNSDEWLNLKNLPNEEWRDIKDYEGLYQVSNYGRIKHLDTIIFSERYYKNGKKVSEKIMTCKSSKGSKGYNRILLYKDGVGKSFKAHRLVAQAFIPNPHINEIKTDNRVENLEWCTNGENGAHAWRTGLRKKNKYE